MCNKWKNHFSEMKGDVGMSPHEKEGEQGDAYTKTETPIPTSLFLSDVYIAICCLWIRILHACN